MGGGKGGELGLACKIKLDFFFFLKKRELGDAVHDEYRQKALNKVLANWLQQHKTYNTQGPNRMP